MRCAVGLMLATITIVACSGSDAEPPPLETAPAITTMPTSDAPPSTDTTTESGDTSVTSAADTTAATTIPAPTTTIDEAAILAEAEAASVRAVQVSLETIRNPDDPANEKRLRDHFTLNNLDLVLDNLELTRSGNFVADENRENPSFALTYGDAMFTNDSMDEVSLTVCEFYSDRLFERGTAPDGGNSLVRDEPLTQILRVEMVLDNDAWKSARGNVAETVNDQGERCTSAS